MWKRFGDVNGGTEGDDRSGWRGGDAERGQASGPFVPQRGMAQAPALQRGAGFSLGGKSVTIEAFASREARSGEG
jgi:hypothetical protein